MDFDPEDVILSAMADDSEVRNVNFGKGTVSTISVPKDFNVGEASQVHVDLCVDYLEDVRKSVTGEVELRQSEMPFLEVRCAQPVMLLHPSVTDEDPYYQGGATPVRGDRTSRQLGTSRNAKKTAAGERSATH